MGILDEVTQMQNQGQTEGQITTTLKENGVSPQEINDALNQSRIKNAVSHEEYPPQQIQKNHYTPQAREQTYVPQESDEQIYVPQPIEQEYIPQMEQEYVPQKTQYQPEPVQQNYYEGSSGGGYGTDTMVEIAEQVFQEKATKMQNQLDNLNEIKTLLKSTVENISERLQRIETTIDKLQISILDKVGSYGENLNSIKKEMSMMQDSFGKMSNNIADRKTKKKTPLS